jgi:hypothetical protein
MDGTIENYQDLKAKYEKLQKDYKDIRKHLMSECKHTTQLEAEILDINTSTMNNIIENNKRFSNN